MGLEINILTEMLIALGGLVNLDSIVDLLMFPKFVIKTSLICIVSTMFRLFRRAMFLPNYCLYIASLRIGKHHIVKNIASLRKVNK